MSEDEDYVSPLNLIFRPILRLVCKMFGHDWGKIEYESLGKTPRQHCNRCRVVRFPDEWE